MEGWSIRERGAGRGEKVEEGVGGDKATVH